MKCVFAFLLAAFCVSCSSPEKKIERSLAGGRCEEAYAKMSEQDVGAKMVTRAQKAGGTLLSYAFTGVSYTAEVLLDVGGGTVMFVALCGPLIAAAAANKNGTYASNSIGCFPGKFDALFVPPLGKRAYASSQPLRCPNVDPMSRSLRRVAACFEARNTPADLERAYTSLKSVADSGDFYKCLSKDEQASVSGAVESLRYKTAHED